MKRSAADIKADLKAHVDFLAEAGAGGGYVCSSSNSIHSGVRPELYRAMVDAIHTYGRYPLSW